MLAISIFIIILALIIWFSVVTFTNKDANGLIPLPFMLLVGWVLIIVLGTFGEDKINYYECEEYATNKTIVVQPIDSNIKAMLTQDMMFLGEELQIKETKKCNIFGGIVTTQYEIVIEEQKQ